MSTAPTRGRIPVDRDSWMWRIYETWADRAGKHRSLVDLCHFMRVLLIFAPLRWYAQKTWQIGRVSIQPWSISLVLWLGATLSYSIAAYPSFMQTAAIIVFVSMVGAAAFGAFAYWVVSDWSDTRTDRTLAIAKWGTVWIWGPFLCLFIAILWIWDYVIVPTAVWFVRPLFYIQTMPIVPLLLLLIGIWVTNFYFFTKGALIGTGLALLVVAIIVGLITAGVAIKDWLDDRPPKPPKPHQPVVYVEPKEPHEHWRGIKTLWRWLVAKKHRICPLIEPQ